MKVKLRMRMTTEKDFPSRVIAAVSLYVQTDER
jgi:hypothetical protein